MILKKIGKLKEAELSIRKAIKLNPNYATSHFNLGNILSDLGQSKEAAISMQKAIKIKNNFPEALSNLGSIYIKLGRLEEAEIVLKKAIEQNSKSEQYKINLAICYANKGDLNSSLLKLELLNKDHPNNKACKLLLAILKGRMRKEAKVSITKNSKDSIRKEDIHLKPLILNRPVEEDLINEIYKIDTRNAKDKNRFQVPIFGNTYGSNYNILEKKVDTIQSFRKDIITILSHKFNSQIYIADSFFNIISPKNGIGGGNEIHSHISPIDKVPGLELLKQKFSLVYYLSIGDQNCSEPGILKFHNPDDATLPKEGSLIIFPASRLHSISYNGSKDRVVISINFYII